MLSSDISGSGIKSGKTGLSFLIWLFLSILLCIFLLKAEAGFVLGASSWFPKPPELWEYFTAHSHKPLRLPPHLCFPILSWHAVVVTEASLCLVKLARNWDSWQQFKRSYKLQLQGYNKYISTVSKIWTGTWLKEAETTNSTDSGNQFFWEFICCCYNTQRHISSFENRAKLYTSRKHNYLMSSSLIFCPFLKMQRHLDLATLCVTGNLTQIC